MDEIYVGLAITVQDLANEFKVYYSTAESNRGPLPRCVWSLWSKTFVRSNWGPKNSPPMPEDLVAQVTGLDPFRAVIVIVGRALATVSGRSADLEIASVEQFARRYLETPEGRKRQAYLDEHPKP